MKKRYARELSLEELAALPDEESDTSDIPGARGRFLPRRETGDAGRASGR
jgi:hypothetical protein